MVNSLGWSSLANTAANQGGLSAMYQPQQPAVPVKSNVAPTWMDAYKSYISTPEWLKQQSAYGGQIDRPWNADDGTRQAKSAIDTMYQDQLKQWNFDNGQNVGVDQSMLGADAQPNDWNRTRNASAGFFNQVGDGISSAIGTDSGEHGLGRIGKELTSNPLVNAALVAAGSVFGGPAGAGLTNALISRAQGNEWNQVVANGAGAALGSWGVGQVAPGLSGGGMDGLSQTFGGGAAGTSLAPELTGMPIESGGFVGGGAGASSGASGLPALTGMPIESGGFVSAAPGATAATATGTGTAATSLATSNVGKVLGSVLGTGGGIRDVAQTLGTIWSAGKGSENATANQNAINTQIKTLTDMFGQDSPYAKQLRQTLERKDAAAGRNSQYGNRETQLQALLAEKALQSSQAIGGLTQQSSALDNSVNSGRNVQLNALDSLLNKTGVYDWTKSWMNDGLSSLFGD